MLTYELTLLLRTMPKVEIASTLKRNAVSIFDKGGIIRQIDNLGHRKIPYRISANGSSHKEGSYFVIKFNIPRTKLEDLDSECQRDVDIIRSKIYKVVEEEPHECTIDNDLKPAPYRHEVIKLIEEAKKKEAQKPRFKPKTGLDYYPFQR